MEKNTEVSIGPRVYLVSEVSYDRGNLHVHFIFVYVRMIETMDRSGTVRHEHWKRLRSGPTRDKALVLAGYDPGQWNTYIFHPDGTKERL